jgi:hypothetical protein
LKKLIFLILVVSGVLTGCGSENNDVKTSPSSDVGLDPASALNICSVELAEEALIANSNAYAFVGVHLISMTSDLVVEQQTVITKNDKIVWIGNDSDAVLDQNTTIINAQGRYLIPGMSDMHIHKASRDQLAIYVANGITLVRNLFGSPGHLRVRDEANSGEILGPRLFTAGPIIDGEEPVHAGSDVAVTAQDARDIVLAQKNAGYDFLKVYSQLSSDAYNEVVAFGKEQDMPVIGHVPLQVGLDNVLISQQRSIEHLHGFSEKFGDSSWSSVAESTIKSLAGEIAVYNTWHVPTVSVYQTLALRPNEIDEFLAKDELRYFCDEEINNTSFEEHILDLRSLSEQRVDARVSAIDNIRRMVLALHEYGAKIVSGTDVGNPLLIAGYSLHDELAQLVDSGISPFEVLKTTTINAAELIGLEDELGTIEIGKKADFVLLFNNPLQDINAVRKNDGVMIRGQWFSRDELQQRLENIATLYGN